MRHVQMPALFPHQEAELAFLKSRERTLLVSEVGTGKTATLIALASHVLDMGGSVLWSTETGLVNQLLDESKIWIGPDKSPTPLNSADGSSPFIVATHGQVRTRIESLRWLSPELLIIDEASVVGGGGDRPSNATYQSHFELSRRSARSVLATATPVGSVHGLDLLALMEVGQLPGLPSRTSVHSHLFHADISNGYGGTHRIFTGIKASGIQLLTGPLATSAIRTTAAEIGQELPSVRRKTIEVELDRSRRSDYEAAKAFSGLQRHQRQQAASRSPRDLVNAAVRALTAEIERDGHLKIVAFTENFDIAEPLAQALEAAGESVVRLNGTMSPAQRARALQRHRRPGRSILVGTGAVENGINLQYCSLVVSVVQTWSHTREVQREGRFVRLGSPHREVVHVVISPRASIEDRKGGILARKARLMDAVLASVPSTSQRRLHLAN